MPACSRGLQGVRISCEVWAPCLPFLFSPDIERMLMQSLRLILLCFIFVGLPSTAHADWRWADPKIEVKPIKTKCKTGECHRTVKLVTKAKLRYRIFLYNLHKTEEWAHWTSLYIPSCTWYGESGYGPEYARYRYTMPNSTGSGAIGKFQFMPGTYHSRAKYHDWSPLDQEIAARREYWAHGTAPWENC